MRASASAPRLPFYTPSIARAVRQFSSTRAIMTATKIDGTAIAKSIREKLGGYIREKQASNPRYRPSLKIVQGTTPRPLSAVRAVRL